MRGDEEYYDQGYQGVKPEALFIVSRGEGCHDSGVV